jgi:prevent-host-death family protein
MKSISAVQAEADLDAVLNSAQMERIVITRAGKPSVVVVGVESYDAEDLEIAGSPEFWRMIEQRRRGRSIPLAKLKARLKSKSREKGDKSHD